MMHWRDNWTAFHIKQAALALLCGRSRQSSKGEIGIDIGQDRPDVCGVPLCTHAHASAGGYLARAVGWMSRVSSDTHGSMGIKTKKIWVEVTCLGAEDVCGNDLHRVGAIALFKHLQARHP